MTATARNTEAALSQQVEYLQELVVQLRELAVPSKIKVPPEWKLTPTERVIYRCLAAHVEVPHDSLLKAIEIECRSNNTDELSLRVMVSRVRKKLKPHGIHIGTSWGYGYYLDREQPHER